MPDRDCHWSWALLSPTRGWGSGTPDDPDYTSRVELKHERQAEFFKGIPPREMDAGYFVFVDSYGALDRAGLKGHVLEEISRIREREHWPKRINGRLYAELMVDMAMVEVIEPKIRQLPQWWHDIADVGAVEWGQRYANKYERIWRLINDWAWAADERVRENANKLKKVVAAS